MRKFGIFIYEIFLLFSFLGVLFIPFSFRYFEVQSTITRFLFEDLILLIASRFVVIHIANPAITSDSTTLYILLGILFFSAIVIVATTSRFHFWKKYQVQIVQSIQLVLTFYLSIIMLKYGFDKIFKAQFYIPEPNILYTPLGMLDKDILYWSSMGTSHLYNVFMGFSEVIPAIMLLFSRTRIPGLCILTGVLTNVVFINLGFDISVKLYSSFLLLLCLILLAPSVKAMVNFFVLDKPARLNSISGSTLLQSNTARVAIKLTVVILFFVESIFPYIQSGQYNDDHVPRNYLHGAYEIMEIEGDIANQQIANLNLKRVFIHRKNYFIMQYHDDTMEDFYLKTDSAQSLLFLTNYEGETIPVAYEYSESTKELKLTFVDLDLTFYCQSLPWRELPLLQPLFHFTVDEID